MTQETIVLRFVDADSGQLLGEHPAPAGQVPESFDVATTLDIGGVRFEVTHAEPSTRAAAAAQGFMTLRLRRLDVRKVDPKELLCSLPSISNELPPMSAAPPGTPLRLHEDDWRQVELLSPAAAELAASDLAAIADVHRTQRAGSGFRKLHVRTAVREPLADAAVKLEDLARALHAGPPSPLSFERADGAVLDGFALHSPAGIVAYGRAAGGLALEVGFVRTAEAPPVRGKWLDLAAWISDRRLLLVDWCRVRTAGQVAGVQALLADLWPRAGESPGRIFLGLRRT